MEATVGIDVGTQGLKVLVRDAASGRVLARASRAYGLLPRSGDSCAEQEPATWLEALQSALGEVLAAPGLEAARVTAAGVSGQQHGMVCLDAQQAVLRPAKLWCDVESAPEAAELSKAWGVVTPAGFTATKVLWLKRHEPENFAKMATLLLPHDYVNFVLCGRLAMERGDASGTGLLDVGAGAWDSERAKRVDESMLKLLPELVGPDAPVGKVTAAAAARFGLPEGALLAPGGGDNMMSALGAGAVQPGIFVVSLGTSATLFGYSASPVLDPSGTVAPFCDSTGGWLPLLCTMNCTAALEEVRAAFGLAHAELAELARREPAGCGGASFLPYFTGERTPNWPHASGALLGLRPGSLRPGLLYRAAMEGATFSILAGYRYMQSMGLKATELRLVGGGSKSPLWRQVIADCFQLAVLLPEEPESAALGGALAAAAMAAGIPVGKYVQEHQPPLSGEVVRPDPAAFEAYEAAFQRHQQAGRRLFEEPAAGHSRGDRSRSRSCPRRAA